MLRIKRAAGALLVSISSAVVPAHAAEPVRIGIISEYSGQFAEFGSQMDAGIKIWLNEHGNQLAGHPVEFVRKDTAGPNPDAAKRMAQELIVNEHVDVLMGFGFTPNAAAVAPLATTAGKPMIVLNAASTGLTTKSPLMIRTSFDLGQVARAIALWASQNNIHNVATIVGDYTPGRDAEKAFTDAFAAHGGKVGLSLRVPPSTVEFSPFLQRVRDLKPDAVFVFLNGGNVASGFLRGYKELGLEAQGIKLIATGDVVDETVLQVVGPLAINTVSSYPYSMTHPSAENTRFVKGFEALNLPHARPSTMAVSAYDAMELLDKALRSSKDVHNGPAVAQALRGLKVTSPRGPIEIDAKTGDILQRMYIRVTKSNNGLITNEEFDTIEPEKLQ